MAFVPYTRRIRTVRAKAEVGPQVVITKSGGMNLNLAAQRAINAEFVILAYDAETNRIALIPASEDVPYAVPVRRVPGSHQKQISGRGFLAVNKISREQARRFQATVDGEGRLTFRVQSGKRVSPIPTTANGRQPDAQPPTRRATRGPAPAGAINKAVVAPVETLEEDDASLGNVPVATLVVDTVQAVVGASSGPTEDVAEAGVGKKGKGKKSGKGKQRKSGKS